MYCYLNRRQRQVGSGAFSTLNRKEASTEVLTRGSNLSSLVDTFSLYRKLNPLFSDQKREAEICIISGMNIAVCHRVRLLADRS